jgi:hypothetical protein
MSPKMLEKTEGAIKNGQSRATGHTKHRTKTSKAKQKQKTTQHKKKEIKSNKDPTKKG